MRVRRNKNQVPAERLSGDQCVVFTDALAFAFEFRANLSCCMRVLLGVVEHCNGARQKGMQPVGILTDAATFRHSVPKLMGND